LDRVNIVRSGASRQSGGMGVGRPLIGISTSELRVSPGNREAQQADPERRELALGLKYLDAVEAVGGVPVILAPIPPEALDALLDRLSGIVLSGGPDLHPSAYGHDEHPDLGPTEPDLDRFEISLVRRADARRLPTLGVCRGAQVLNVARGGTLHQHLPGHRQTEAGSETTHDVRLRDRSNVASLLGRTQLGVNSFHHQAIDRLGDGLRVAGRSEDGLVEAIEDPERDYVVGVQWHAECLVEDETHRRLFSALVDAARMRDRMIPVARVATAA
jgi:putative glutamine amidotransferase